MEAKLFATMTSVILLAAAIPAVEAQQASKAPVLALTEDGVETMTAEQFEALGGTDAGTDAAVTCGGTAPLEAYCTTGTHTFESLPIGASCGGGGDDYTGTIETRLDHDGPDLHLFCVYIDGELDRWDWYCCFPAMGEDYEHEGYSYVYSPYEDRGFGLSPVGETLHDPLRSTLGVPFDGEPLGPPGGSGAWTSEVRP